MKRIISVIITTLFILGIFSVSPVSAAKIEKKAKLKLWVPDAECSKAKKLAKKFVKKYKKKKIKVSVTAQTEAESGTMYLADAESSADVSAVACDQMRNLINAKVISPIKSSYAKKAKKSELKEALKACSKGKKLYALPRSCQSYCLVYDKSVVSPAQAKTLEGVLQACKDKNKKFIMDASNGYYSCMFMFTGGLKTNGFKSDGATQKFNNYDAKEVAQTLKAFSQLIHKYNGVFSNKSASEIPSTIGKKTGAGIDGLWDYEANKEMLGDKLGCAMLPTINVGSKNKRIVNMFAYTGYAVNKYSKYPKAAQALAKYISSKSSQKTRASRYMPTNKSLLKSDKVKKHKMMNALAQQQKYSVTQANISGWFWDPMGNMGSKVVSSETKPENFDFEKLVLNTIKTIQDS